jgi:hypothetical protein
MKLEYYEPHMCCPTGLCGPSPDERLIRLKETIETLQKEYPDLEVERYMITRNPHQFRANHDVFDLVSKKGKAALPITAFEGKIIATGDYPAKETIESLIQSKR